MTSSSLHSESPTGGGWLRSRLEHAPDPGDHALHHRLLEVGVGHLGEHGGGVVCLAHPAPQVAQQVGATEAQTDDHKHQPLELEREQRREEEQNLRDTCILGLMEIAIVNQQTLTQSAGAATSPAQKM